MLKSIAPSEIQLGMFVEGFEGSWWQHPFWRSRFVINNPKDLERVRASEVSAVIIDTAKGAEPLEGAQPAPTSSDRSGLQKSADPAQKIAQARMSAAVDVSASTKIYFDENARAAKIVDRSKKIVRQIFDGARLGKAVRSADVLDVVEEVAGSIERSPKALLGIVRLKSKDEYTYLHSVAVCALMVNLSRQLKLPEKEVRDMGVAGLLHDIGKMVIPETVLNKPGRLNDEEFAIVKAHPERGYALLAQGIGIPDAALDVCRHHHEKVDGSGYPFGLTGDQMSQAAKMGAICDVYDALTSNRAYKEAWTTAAAIGAMRSWEGHFDPKLLFAFMQSTSIFPPGMLVRLRSNRLAVVLENGRRTTRPRVKAFYSATDREMITPQVVIIDDSLAHDQIMSEEDPRHWALDNWAELQDRLIHDS
jgi:putative nucleotidyltransferase with HDIG domain